MKISAGILVYRKKQNELEVLLVHPGGPFWAKKDNGAWSIPKGELKNGEQMLDVAYREFEEETGFPVPSGKLIDLGSARMPSGKIVYIWAVLGDIDATQIKSKTISIMWPPFSGKKQEFPEVDRAEWFSIENAEKKISRGQIEFLKRLQEKFDTINY